MVNPFQEAIAYRQQFQGQNGNNQQQSGFSGSSYNSGYNSYNNGWQQQSQQQQPQRVNMNPPPMRIKETDIADIRSTTTCRLSQDLDCEFVTFAHDGISDLNRKLMKEKIHPVYCKSADTVQKSEERSAELSKAIDLSLSDAKWKIFRDRVHQAAVEVGVTPLNVYDKDRTARELDFDNEADARGESDAVRAMRLQMETMQNMQHQMMQYMQMQMMAATSGSATASVSTTHPAAAAPTFDATMMPPPPAHPPVPTEPPIANNAADRERLRNSLFIGTPAAAERSVRPAGERTRSRQRSNSTPVAADAEATRDV